MFKIISVTNRKIALDFESRIQEISKYNIPIILREKDLSEQEYMVLALRLFQITDNIIIHTFTDVAKELNCKSIHLPMHKFRTEELGYFDKIGVSVHSVSEAIEAQNKGADYITAGHIFETDCKKGIEPRGLKFLSRVCDAVNIPVYAIGGITPENTDKVIDAGAGGVCIMSSFMKCKNFEEEYGDYIMKSKI